MEQPAKTQPSPFDAGFMQPPPFDARLRDSVDIQDQPIPAFSTAYAPYGGISGPADTGHVTSGSQCMFPGCTALFRRHSDIRRHIETVHVITRTFWCPVGVCSRSSCAGRPKPFPRKDKRNEHIRKMHKDFQGDTNAFDLSMKERGTSLMADVSNTYYNLAFVAHPVVSSGFGNFQPGGLSFFTPAIDTNNTSGVAERVTLPNIDDLGQTTTGAPFVEYTHPISEHSMFTFSYSERGHVALATAGDVMSQSGRGNEREVSTQVEGSLNGSGGFTDGRDGAPMMQPTFTGGRGYASGLSEHDLFSVYDGDVSAEWCADGENYEEDLNDLGFLINDGTMM